MIRRMMIALAVSSLLAACGGGAKNTEGDQKVAEQSMEKSDDAAEAENADTDEPVDEPESSGQMRGSGMGPMMESCPMHVEGTTMALEDTEKGVAMVFTNSDATADVQERAMQMAEHHPMAMDHHGSTLPDFTVKSEKTDTGARMMMMPSDPADMEAFRAAVHASYDAQGDQQCPIMMMYKKGTGPHGKGRMMESSDS